MLGHPYATDCIDYEIFGYESKSDCYERCLFYAAVKELKKLPFTILIDKPLNMPLISEQDNVNRTFRRRLDELETKCALKCNKNDCTSRTFSPRFSSSGKYINFTIALYHSSSPFLKTS